MWTLSEWKKRAAQQRFICQAQIEGKACDAKSGQTFAVINPATDQILAQVAECGDDEVERAVRAARRAYQRGIWARQSPTARKAVLLRLSELIMQHRDELALLDSLSMGKPVVEAWQLDIPGTAHFFSWYAESLDKIYGQVAPTAADAVATVTRSPLGVVAAIVPWNFPLEMAAWKVAPALAAGNSVLLKPAEQSPFSALRLAELALEAGIPEGVFNVLPGTGAVTGQALGRHPDIDCLVFTGSTRTGKRLMEYAGQSNLKQVWLECGGKSPNLIFADCHDLGLAAENAARAIFYNQGEVCSANSRLLVERPVYEAVVERLIALAAEWTPGDPLDPNSRAGAMVDARQTAKVMDSIAEARRQGARLVCGGERLTINGVTNYIQPTIFTDVAPDSLLAREEIFGPVLAVQPFDSEQQAIAMANDSHYGLAASVWSGSLNRAHRVAQALEVGTVSVNTVDALDICVPFGGGKQSGFGRDLSLHSFDKYTQLKTTWIQLHQSAAPGGDYEAG
ncbi:aldehyde dehydrogenase [Jejubacter calystegiae]|uniref:Aldehyde dehydrogenase n=1 Tax=Jejubacter calystegiae TaxID=2579935 RepID=A0A4P8YJT7_9ENTR|nr:aldehyde dehydrogenase [Jejubacter calystegiae]QCT19894.1 aldehyde dehydrogenase [Jejubacter calystegiae]